MSSFPELDDRVYEGHGGDASKSVLADVPFEAVATAEVPFAPVASTTQRIERAVVALSSGFRWRRPLMLVLVVAVAGSVALAARRSSTITTDLARSSGGLVSDDQVVGVGGSGEDDPSSRRGSMVDIDGVGDASPDGGNGRTPPTLTVGPPGATSISTAVVTVDPTSLSSPSSTATGNAKATTASSVSSTSRAIAPSSPNGETTTGQTSSIQQGSTSSRQTTTSSLTTTTGATTTNTRPTTTTSRPPVVLASNGGFESPNLDEEMVWFDSGEVGPWVSTNGDIQLSQSGFDGISAARGSQFAELNSSSQAGLYQDFATDPGAELSWELYHRGRNGKDEMEIRIGPPGDLKRVKKVKTDSSEWDYHRGTYTVPPGQTTTRFMLWSKESGSYGNLVDGVTVTMD